MIEIPPTYNYIGIFLTFACRLRCSYCINKINIKNKPERDIRSGTDWLSFLDRLDTNDLPITLQGGDPGLHKDFLAIVNNLRSGLKIEILTSLTFDLDRFIAEVDPVRFQRTGPYAPIRVSYHLDFDDLHSLGEKVLRLHNAGFDVGVYTVKTPGDEIRLEQAANFFRQRKIDYRFKELLGHFAGKLHGTYKYPEATTGRPAGNLVRCRTTELLLSPQGMIYRCHHDLYNGLNPIGSIDDPDFSISDIFRSCPNFGMCNPCDVKLKTNRFQEFGHCSVEIKSNEEPDGLPI